MPHIKKLYLNSFQVSTCFTVREKKAAWVNTCYSSVATIKRRLTLNRQASRHLMTLPGPLGSWLWVHSVWPLNTDTMGKEETVKTDPFYVSKRYEPLELQRAAGGKMRGPSQLQTKHEKKNKLSIKWLGHDFTQVIWAWAPKTIFENAQKKNMVYSIKLRFIYSKISFPKQILITNMISHII